MSDSIVDGGLSAPFCVASIVATSPDSSRKDGIAWAAEAENLEYDAQQAGWDIYRPHHICDSCIIQAQYEQEKARA